LFQEFHRFDKAAAGYGYYQIYRIEVFSAIKTSGQVGFRVCRGVEVIAQRTAKAQQRIALADIQPKHIGDNRIDGDPVS